MNDVSELREQLRSFDDDELARVRLMPGAEITPRPIHWLWNHWLACGKIHIIGGQPGTGKTTLALALAATVTIGGLWPDGTKAARGNVLIWSGEDSAEDTLVPRLAAAGADLTRVFFVNDWTLADKSRPFDPSRDVDALARTLGTTEFSLMVVDPIVSAVAGDSHKNAEVRRSLQPLADLATRTGCAVLGITHLTKGTGGSDPLERITGSLAFGAVARLVFIAAKPQDGEGSRMFCRAKSNIGPDGGGYEYDLAGVELSAHPGVFTSVARWGNPLEGSARDLLAVADESPDDTGERSDACRFLADLLADGPVNSKQVMSDARQAGVAERTLHRAKKELGVESLREAMPSGKHHWVWRLPPTITIQPYHRPEE